MPALRQAGWRAGLGLGAWGGSGGWGAKGKGQRQDSRFWSSLRNGQFWSAPDKEQLMVTASLVVELNRGYTRPSYMDPTRVSQYSKFSSFPLKDFLANQSGARMSLPPLWSASLSNSTTNILLMPPLHKALLLINFIANCFSHLLKF